MSLNLVAASGDAPVSLDEAKAHLRVEHGRDDALIASAVQAATSHLQEYTRRQFVLAEWELRLDTWPAHGVIRLPRPPLLEVVSVHYVDPSGAVQLWAPAFYDVETLAGPYAGRGSIRPAYGVRVPPLLRHTFGAVRVRFRAGYGDPSRVPVEIKVAILLISGELYEKRELTVVAGRLHELPLAQMLVWPFRSLEF